MNIETLRDELQADPLALGYAPYIPDAPGMLVELLHARNFSAPKTRMVSARTVLAEVQGGELILDKLEALGESIPAVKWAMRFMVGEEGIDIGHPVTRGLLDQLAAGGALEQSEADALKAMANQPASRAEVLGLHRITEADVRAALEQE